MASEQTKSKKSFLITVIAIVAIALLAVAGYFVWNTYFNNTANKSEHQRLADSESVLERESLGNDAYDGWETYESTRDGYTVQYPKEWTIVPEIEGDGVYIRNKQPLETVYKDGYPKDYIEIRMLKTINDDYGVLGLTAKEYYESLGRTEVSSGAANSSPEAVAEFTLNGQPAKRLKSISTKTREDINILKDDNIYMISIDPYGALNDNDTIRKIVASFTFKD